VIGGTKLRKIFGPARASLKKREKFTSSKLLLAYPLEYHRFDSNVY